jgi:hypothetical protein
MFGLPWPSFLVLILVPLAIVAYQYYVCWQIRRGKRE